jgi:hypothetical protein
VYQTVLYFCRPAPKNEDEMMIAIFECIDRLLRIVRPRKLLYMAIDGVVSTHLCAVVITREPQQQVHSKCTLKLEHNKHRKYLLVFT